MKLREIIKILEKFSPPKLAYFERQNGLLVGNLENNVRTIGVTLDFTNTTLSMAIKSKCDLLIFHNSLNYENPSSKIFKTRLKTATDHKIAILQMHLNLDFCKGGIIDNLCKIMGFEGKPVRLSYQGKTILGGVYTVKTNLNFNELISRVKKLNSKTVSICRERKKIYRKIAITSGNGCKPEFIEQLNVDAFIAGQIGNEAMRLAEELGITLISTTNYSTENEPLKLVTKHIQNLIPVKILFLNHVDSFDYYNSKLLLS